MKVVKTPIVTGCVRTNGSSCAKTSDTTKRYFGTEHGSEIEMTPGALNIKGGSKEPLSISFDDNVGVTIKSPKKLSLNADDEIIIKTPKSVKLNAQSQILVAKTGTQSGFSMETDMHFLSNNVIKNGSDREAYAPFDDEPKVGTKPEPTEQPKEEKKGFNWGKLALGVVAAVAVVAMVALSVATFGAGAVAGAAVIGFCLGAVCGIGKTAISDKNNGKMSSLGTYAKNAVHDGCIFAITSAIFPPLSGVKGTGALGVQVAINLSGKQMLGCAFGEGMLSNYLTQLWDKGEIDVGETIKSGLGSMAFLGLLHGAGKLFEKASPFVKKAAGKIASEISSGAKSTLNKAVGGLDNMLNGINRKLDKFVYDMNKSLNLQPELAGVGDVYIPPEESTFLKDKMSKITGESGTKGGSKANEATPIGGGARYGKQKISNELYNKLRKQTPNDQIRDMVNEGVDLPMEDFALTGRQITSRLEADHIVSMKKIVCMEGFEKLSYQQQVSILNYEENFIGLSKVANTSKGAKSYEEWMLYKKGNIKVNPEFRQRMIRIEKELEGQIQSLIDDFLKK